MLAQMAVLATALTAQAPTTDSPVAARIRVDSAKNQVVVMVGPLHIAPAAYDQHATAAPVKFEWPVTGYLRGYRIDVVGADGALLPRALLHHAGVANLDRRQLAYPMVERLLAAGPETRPLELPASVGIPLDAGSHLMLYYMLVNTADTAVDGAWLKLTVPMAPAGKRLRSIMPLPLDANPNIGSFDVPPGRSEMSNEFTLPVGGRLRRLGGHLHDYGVEVRLEDAESGKVLVRLESTRTADGKLTAVRTENFPLKLRGYRLKANHRYRIVGVYQNPTCATIKRGAMAFAVGAFLPDDMRRWPAVNMEEPGFAYDVEWLYAHGSAPEHGQQAQSAGHEHGHADHGSQPPCVATK